MAEKKRCMERCGRGTAASKHPFHYYLEPQTTICKWMFQLDDSKSLYRKWLFHQTSIYKWLFGVPGMNVYSIASKSGAVNDKWSSMMIHFWCIICVCIGKSNSRPWSQYIWGIPSFVLRCKLYLQTKTSLWRNPTLSFLDPVLSHPGKNSPPRRRWLRSRKSHQAWKNYSTCGWKIGWYLGS